MRTALNEAFAIVEKFSQYRHVRLSLVTIDKFSAGDHNGALVIVNAQDVQKAGLPGD
jgi:hypothetical protein